MRKFLATRNASAKVPPRESAPSVHETTLVCLSPRSLLAARRRGRALSDRVPQAFTVALEETDSVPAREADAIAIAFAQAGIVTEARTNSQALSDAEAFAHTDADSKLVVDPETFPDTQAFAVGETGC
jgi:hypothetical protein